MENFNAASTAVSPKEKFTTEEKLTLEIEKLKEEIKNYRKPFYYNPIAIVAIVTSLLSILSFFYNLQIAEKKTIENRIIYAQAKLEFLQNKKFNDSLKIEIKKNTQLIKEKNNTIDVASKSLESIGESLNNFKEAETVEQKDAIIKTISTEVSKTNKVFVKNSGKNIDIAKNEEIKGFQYLADKDYDNALNSFVRSENAFNQYHVSYDIAKILLDNKVEMTSDSRKSKEIVEAIITKYGNYAPEKVREQIKSEKN